MLPLFVESPSTVNMPPNVVEIVAEVSLKKTPRRLAEFLALIEPKPVFVKRALTVRLDAVSTAIDPVFRTTSTNPWLSEPKLNMLRLMSPEPVISKALAFVTTIVPLLRRPLAIRARSEEHTSELQSQSNLVCRLLLEKKTIH